MFVCPTNDMVQSNEDKSTAGTLTISGFSDETSSDISNPYAHNHQTIKIVVLTKIK